MQVVSAQRMPANTCYCQPFGIDGLYTCYLNGCTAVFDIGTTAVYYAEYDDDDACYTVFVHNGIKYALQWHLGRIWLMDVRRCSAVASVAEPCSNSCSWILKCARIDREDNVYRIVCTSDTMIIELNIDWSSIS